MGGSHLLLCLLHLARDRMDFHGPSWRIDAARHNNLTAWLLIAALHSDSGLCECNVTFALTDLALQLMCLSPSESARWIAVLGGFTISALFLLRNLSACTPSDPSVDNLPMPAAVATTSSGNVIQFVTQFSKTKTAAVIGADLACQAAMAMAIKFYFFP